MIEIFGRGYVINHCISTLKHKREERQYRIYITDALRAIAKGEYPIKRYAEIFENNTTNNQNNDNRTGDEIALDVISRAGLILVN